MRVLQNPTEGPNLMYRTHQMDYTIVKIMSTCPPYYAGKMSFSKNTFKEFFPCYICCPYIWSKKKTSLRLVWGEYSQCGTPLQIYFVFPVLSGPQWRSVYDGFLTHLALHNHSFPTLPTLTPFFPPSLISLC